MKPFNLRNFAILTAYITLKRVHDGSPAVVGQRQPDPSKIFDSADANGDGVITREEFQAARERAFSKLDNNGDGS